MIMYLLMMIYLFMMMYLLMITYLLMIMYLNNLWLRFQQARPWNWWQRKRAKC